MALGYNPDKVRKITSEILGSLERVEELKNLPMNEFLSDPHKIGSAKYHFIFAIEGIIDLCNHVITKNNFRTPEDYADTFRVMAERGTFDEGFTETMIQMSRFRNRLVHIYWEVDSHELYRLPKAALTTSGLFLKNLASSFLSTKSFEL